MKAEIRLTEGLTMMAKSESDQWVVMDPGASSGGIGGAPTPMEFVLMAFGSCIAMTTTALLRKKTSELEELSVELDADRSETSPRAFTHITAKFIVRGKELKENDVEWAIKQAHARFCPVGAMLGKAVELDYEWEVR
ncbi:MAG: OsmC family protein [Alphaproteobacteria bacterium]|jgi:putative redox protein